MPDRGPFRRGFWRSPLRGEWLSSLLGSALLPLLVVSGVTGFLSHAAYDPDLGANSVTGGFEDSIYFFDWPTSPAWLYAVTQGMHVTSGLAAIPLLLAKLWSVIPKLWERPPARSIAHLVERLDDALIVGSSLFLFVTGVLNIQYWYAFSFSFVPAHYYAAYVFVGSLTLHVALKLPVVTRAFRDYGVLKPLGEGMERMRAASPPGAKLTPEDPAEPTISRRGLLAAVGAGSAGLAAMAFGQTAAGRFLPDFLLLTPRSRDYGDGPNDFQVNKTARAASIAESDVGPSWRLELAGGPSPVRLSREELIALPQRTEELTISCVEGWSTTQTWTGVPLRELARIAGVESPGQVTVESAQPAGAFRQATLNGGQIDDPRSLLALKVNGADLSLDHGYPARIMVPALPGVHNTKWVARLSFGSA